MLITNWKCSFGQSLFYCELHYRNTQSHLSLEVRKQPELVKSECLCVTLLILICQGRNQARSLEYKIISHIYNIVYLSVLCKCSLNTAFPFSGNRFQVWCQLAPLHTSMRWHRLIHGMMSAHQPADLRNLQSPFQSCPCKYLRVFKCRFNNLSH